MNEILFLQIAVAMEGIILLGVIIISLKIANALMQIGSTAKELIEPLKGLIEKEKNQ